MSDEVIVGGKSRPFQKRVRKQGWTQTRRKRFLEALAETCNVRRACAAAEMSTSTAYFLRQRDQAFADLWQQALETGYDLLEAAILEHALLGVNAITIEPGEIEIVEERAKRVPPGREARPVAKVDLQTALQVLGRHRGSVERGAATGGSTKRATTEETDKALMRKLDALAKRLRAGT